MTTYTIKARLRGKQSPVEHVVTDKVIALKLFEEYFYEKHVRVTELWLMVDGIVYRYVDMHTSVDTFLSVIKWIKEKFNAFLQARKSSKS